MNRLPERNPRICQKDMASFGMSSKRIKRPHLYKVDLSDRLYNLKKNC